MCFNRLGAAVLMVIIASLSAGGSAHEVTSPAVKGRFEYLSRNGNSNCSLGFLEEIRSMPDMALIQGSCCSPMDLDRYDQQVAGLKQYAEIPEVPRDPYDVPAGLAKRLLAAYDLELTPAEQAAYDAAMDQADEGGPCCCQCWRWHVFGGLGKLLIRTYGFTGAQIAEVWNLSDGCGGSGDHQHG